MSSTATAGDGEKKKYKTLLMDMDGVLAEVSRSYRAAIEATCHQYGATSVTQDAITESKIIGNANDDWKLSYDLIRADPNGRQDVTLEQVTETFEEYYQGKAGDSSKPGLYKLETLIPKRETLLELKKRSAAGVGIVTGRPRNDCMTFLRTHDLEDLIDATYCMEDGPSKPSPVPVETCCKALNVAPDRTVVLVGDTPDDVTAAVSAGCSAVGVTTPEGCEASEAKSESHTDSKIAVAMQQAGADCILKPGFANLVDMFEETEDPPKSP